MTTVWFTSIGPPLMEGSLLTVKPGQSGTVSYITIGAPLLAITVIGRINYVRN